ncbi:MAG TPA: hypothetical protein DCS93_24765, partial [Microscillaceae bacterium]|nr:hypothetical protein [Microscillaceae bacterium]
WLKKVGRQRQVLQIMEILTGTQDVFSIAKKVITPGVFMQVIFYTFFAKIKSREPQYLFIEV